MCRYVRAYVQACINKLTIAFRAEKYESINTAIRSKRKKNPYKCQLPASNTQYSTNAQKFCFLFTLADKKYDVE